MFDSSERDLARTLTEMERTARERSNFDQSEAKGKFREFLQSDRRFDPYDKEPPVTAVEVDASLALQQQLQKLQESEQLQRQHQRAPQQLPQTREQKLHLWKQQGLSDVEASFLQRNPAMIDFPEVTTLAANEAMQAGHARDTEPYWRAVTMNFDSHLTRLREQAAAAANPVAQSTPEFFRPPLPPAPPSHSHLVSAPVSRILPGSNIERDLNPKRMTLTAEEMQIAQASGADQLRALVQAFKGSALFPIVAVAAYTGARRNEILGLRWIDLDPIKKTLQIERAIEETEEFGLRIKGPKTERGKRTITIDDDLIALLLSLREKHLRIMAGIPDGALVDLSLVNLPGDALMFPNPSSADFSFTQPRVPRAVTKVFAQKATKLGFPALRFHDLRGSHETALLDAGVPVHVVAARCGHDPAVLLRSYAKRTKKADTSAAAAIGALSRGTLT